MTTEKSRSIVAFKDKTPIKSFWMASDVLQDKYVRPHMMEQVWSGITIEEYINRDLDLCIHVYIDLQRCVWFNGREISSVLGFGESVRSIKRRVDPDDRIILQQRNGAFDQIIINESAMYIMVYTSSSPEYARKLKRWIKDEVLPKAKTTPLCLDETSSSDSEDLEISAVYV